MEQYKVSEPCYSGTLIYYYALISHRFAIEYPVSTKINFKRHYM